VGGGGHGGQIADPAQNVGILHHHAGGLIINAGDQPVQIRLWLDRRHCIGDRVAGELGHRFDYARIMRMQRA